MIRQHRDDTLPFGSNFFCSFILLADNRIRVFPDNGFGIPYVEVEDNATPTHNFGYAHLGAGIDKLTLRTNDVVAMNYFDGTQVYVPSLGTDIHLTVDTGAGTYDEVILGDGNSIQEQAVVKTGAGHDIVQRDRRFWLRSVAGPGKRAGRLQRRGGSSGSGARNQPPSHVC